MRVIRNGGSFLVTEILQRGRCGEDISSSSNARLSEVGTV